VILADPGTAIAVTGKGGHLRMAAPAHDRTEGSI